MLPDGHTCREQLVDHRPSALGVLGIPEAVQGTAGRVSSGLVGIRISPEQTRNLGEVAIGLDQDGVVQHRLDSEGGDRPDPAGIVILGAEQLDQVGIAVVLGVARALGCVVELHVHALIDRHLVGSEGDPSQRFVPQRGVVHPRLPGMPDLHEAAHIAGALSVQVVVPGHELGEQLFQERRRIGAICGVPVHPQRGGRVHGGLDDPRRPRPGRCMLRALDLPVVGTREVPAPCVAEDDVRQKAVAPLPGEERTQLKLGPLLVVMRIPHGDESRVPAPLMRIQLRRGSGDAVELVGDQHRHRRARQLVVADYQLRHRRLLRRHSSADPLRTRVVAVQPAKPSSNLAGLPCQGAWHTACYRDVTGFRYGGQELSPCTVRAPSTRRPCERRDPTKRRSAAAVASSACSGDKNREIHRTSRASASRSS